MKRKGWRKIPKMWPSDSGQSWQNVRLGITVAFATERRRFFFYGEKVNNSLWTGKTWATAEEAANAAEREAEVAKLKEKP